VDVFTIVLLLAALLAIFRLKIGSIWLIPAGAVLGVIYKLAAGWPR
jgi:4-hydroxybenzoate polyprenyltransferase